MTTQILIHLQMYHRREDVGQTSGRALVSFWCSCSPHVLSINSHELVGIAQESTNLQRLMTPKFC